MYEGILYLPILYLLYYILVYCISSMLSDICLKYLSMHSRIGQTISSLILMLGARVQFIARAAH